MPRARGTANLAKDLSGRVQLHRERRMPQLTGPTSGSENTGRFPVTGSTFLP